MQKKAQQHVNVTEPTHSLNYNTSNSPTTLYDTLKARFLAGNKVCAIDYHESVRAEVLGAIKTLQDELPIVTGWRTIRQSYLSETRTRARSYHIPEAFLHDGGTL